MGDAPNTSLGAQEKSLPPSSMSMDPSRFE
jgi:hypothetical protein